MTSPLVDVIIPLHRADRPILDAVASAGTPAQGIETSVSVVLHNLDLAERSIAAIQQHARVLRCTDGVPSPSGPRNVGIETATAPFVFFLDSDDQLAPRCLERLHAAASETGAEVALPSIRRGDRFLGTPLVFTRDAGLLGVTRHQLFLRSHSFALIRRTALVSTGIRYPDAVRSGEDLVFMAELYSRCSTTVAFDAVYLLRDDSIDRISTSALPGEDQLAAAHTLLDADWVLALPDNQREALVRRILSVNLAGGFRRMRQQGHEPDIGEHRQVRELAANRSDTATDLLSVRDRCSLRFEAPPSITRTLLLSKPFGLLPTTWRGAISLDGPLATEARAWLVRHRRRRADATRATGRFR